MDISLSSNITEPINLKNLFKKIAIDIILYNKFFNNRFQNPSKIIDLFVDKFNNFKFSKLLKIPAYIIPFYNLGTFLSLDFDSQITPKIYSHFKRLQIKPKQNLDIIQEGSNENYSSSFSSSIKPELITLISHKAKLLARLMFLKGIDIQEFKNKFGIYNKILIESFEQLKRKNIKISRSNLEKLIKSVYSENNKNEIKSIPLFEFLLMSELKLIKSEEDFILSKKSTIKTFTLEDFFKKFALDLLIYKYKDEDISLISDIFLKILLETSNDSYSDYLTELNETNDILFENFTTTSQRSIKEDIDKTKEIIDKIINEKASKLAHYFLIMNEKLSSSINIGNLINNHYKLRLKTLNDNYKSHENNNSYASLGYLMGTFNQAYNININNYGSEGNILYTISDNFTYINIIEEYIKNLKIGEEEGQLSSGNYNYQDYIKKIGSDIAIILFLFSKHKPDKLDEDYLNKKFINFYLTEYKNLETEEVQTTIEQLYKNAIALVPEFKTIFEEEKGYQEKKQRAYNLYKYPKKILDGYHTIFYLKNHSTSV